MTPAADGTGDGNGILVLAPAGRDAALAIALLAEAGLDAVPCRDPPALVAALARGAGAVLVTEEALERGLAPLQDWVRAQPAWSDLPFIVLTRSGASDRAGAAARITAALGNVSFLERPFHSTTLVSVARSALSSRRRQRLARDALEQAAATAERLGFALQAGRLGAWELEVDTLELRASAACKAVFGRPPDAPFTYADLCDAIHPDDRQRMQEAVAAALTDGGNYEIEYRTMWPDGALHWAQIRGRAVAGPDGRRRMAGVSLDTTARRAAEEELRAHRERLEELVAARTEELAAANSALRDAAEQREITEAALAQAQKMEAVGQLTGGLAHDFNNLLQAVLASLDLIRRRATDPVQVDRLATAGADAARRGAKLTRQLLAFSRTQKLQLAPLDVPALLEGMRDLLARSLGPGVEITIDAPAALPPALGDAVQLELAVLNLSINARDAMPGGGRLTIRAAMRAEPAATDLPAGRYLAVSVADTGEGMPAAVLARAFEPFFTTKGVGQGTGLGLSQVYGIARQSGGAARLASVPGMGTTVTILLPLAGEAAAAEALARPPEEPVRRATGGNGALVLVVDDDARVRRSFAEWLDALGYRVTEAADGRAGLEALDRTAPDLLLVDYAMPGMTGAAVAREALRRRPGLPVVLATGHADEGALGDAGLAGLPTLRKPFGVEELADTLATALARAPTPA